MITFKDAANFKIPFGRHSGRAIDKVSLTYLDWCVWQLDDGGSFIHSYPDFVEALTEYMSNESVKRELENELENKNRDDDET